jgi:hypothetical protein
MATEEDNQRGREGKLLNSKKMCVYWEFGTPVAACSLGSFFSKI